MSRFITWTCVSGLVAAALASAFALAFGESLVSWCVSAFIAVGVPIGAAKITLHPESARNRVADALEAARSDATAELHELACQKWHRSIAHHDDLAAVADLAALVAFGASCAAMVATFFLLPSSARTDWISFLEFGLVGVAGVGFSGFALAQIPYSSAMRRLSEVDSLLVRDVQAWAEREQRADAPEPQPIG